MACRSAADGRSKLARIHSVFLHRSQRIRMASAGVAEEPLQIGWRIPVLHAAMDASNANQLTGLMSLGERPRARSPFSTLLWHRERNRNICLAPSSLGNKVDHRILRANGNAKHNADGVMLVAVLRICDADPYPFDPAIAQADGSRAG
jgi:hypothetical protein